MDGGVSEIGAFFRDKTVLITGATGFVGKLLVEKMLRTCDVRRVYATVRPKKGKEVAQRLDEYFDNSVYERLKFERGAEVVGKLRVVSADISLVRLGMSEEDRKVLVDEVDVVIHSAATTRFDETLRVAAGINVRGTLEILKLCEEMKHLKSVVHVSTAFSFCVKSDINEETYESPIKGVELLKVVDALDDETLNDITPVLLRDWPNTYVFTKSVAEGLIWDYWNKLPIVMIRPSIIIATEREPVPGWIENLMGVSGIFAGVFMGAIRTFQCKSDNRAELVPADHVVNCTLAAAAATNKNRRKQDEGRPVYNCVTSCQNPLTWDQCIENGTKHAEEFPTIHSVWYLFIVLSQHRYLYLLLHFFLHIVPAIATDICAMCLGRKTEAIKQYRKLVNFLDVFSYFATRQWDFSNDNTQELWRGLSDYDREQYNFDAAAIDWEAYFRNFIRGGRIYMMKDPLDTLPQARAKQVKLKIAHYTLMSILTVALIYGVAYAGTCILSRYA